MLKNNVIHVDFSGGPDKTSLVQVTVHYDSEGKVMHVTFEPGVTRLCLSPIDVDRFISILIGQFVKMKEDMEKEN